MEKIVNKILGKFNIGLVRTFPRHSVRFAKKYFKNKPIKVAEIGTFKGENAKNIMETLNVDKIYLIDPWEEHENFSKIAPEITQKILSNAEKIAKKRLGKHNNKIFFIKKYSDEAINDIPDNMDYIYIDGNHSYKQAKKDMKNYWPKVNKGGILAGHDITASHDKKEGGVARAFVEFCSEKNLRPRITRTDWIIIKT
ncbi:MAG: class I SAM-dependent methyltransferase [Candidatus Pacearchaeota archaeon]